MIASSTMTPAKAINDPDCQRRINALRKLDNVAGWYYLAREYFYLALCVGLPIVFFQWREASGLSWPWDVPVVLLAIVLVGAGQHRLVTLTHEAGHYMLFRSRLLNEFVSDWFCMFPMFSNTHDYRLQHLAHHQFVNDPERDPDVAQMTSSGHRYEFPMTPARFVWECVLKQILFPMRLVNYIRARARFNAMGGGSGPYAQRGPRSRLPIRIAILLLLTLPSALGAAVWSGNPWLLALVPTIMLASALAIVAALPARHFPQPLVKPDIAPRWTMILRLTHLTLVFSTIAWLTYLTGSPWWLYYLILWLVPLFTMFSFCMLLRQLVQHGNASRERFTNTRIFLVNHLIRFSVFPLGNEYHLPHHLFPMVPFYRLPELHDLLMQTDDYRRQAVVVEGYFFHRDDPPENPTVVELMAAPKS